MVTKDKTRNNKNSTKTSITPAKNINQSTPVQASTRDQPQRTSTSLQDDNLPEVHARQLADPRLQSAVQRQTFLNRIQHQHGNRHVQRVVDQVEKTKPTESNPAVQRSVISWLDTQRHNAMEGLGMESTQDADRGRATAFYAGGPYGPKTVIGAGGRGGFDVTYDPMSGVEEITINGGVRFQDGLTVAGGVITPFNSDLQGRATQAAALPPAQQAAFLAGYQWVPGDKAPWLTQLRNAVVSTWQNQHEFFINKPEWEWLTANVTINVNLRAMTAGEARADTDHLVVDTVKEPAGQSQTGAEVAPGSGTNAFDQVMTISSSDVNPRTDNLLAGGDSMSVFFDHDSDTLTAAATAKLDTFILTYQGAPGNAASNPTKITLTGHTSASGSASYNESLSQRRIDAVKAYLGGNGFTNIETRSEGKAAGETGADENATAPEQERERRVDMVVDDGAAQNVAAHEFGHAFGLGDEYATNPGSRISGTGSTPGTAAAHDGLAKNMTLPDGTNLPGAIHENNEGIMSLGNTVRPQHYATFHMALTDVTGISEWALGPAPPTATGSAAATADEGSDGA